MTTSRFESVGSDSRPTFFAWGEAAEFGRETAGYVKNNMVGGPLCYSDDMAVLSQMIVNGGGGNHVEIGAGWGFSAVVAALTLEHFDLPGTVYAIDPMDAREMSPVNGEVDREMRHMEEYFQDNLARFQVADRVCLIKAASFPFPIKDTRFSTAFIDGSHSYDGAATDWFSLKDIVDNYIMFHDYGQHFFGVVQAVWRYAFGNPFWVPAHVSSIVCVMRNLNRRALI